MIILDEIDQKAIVAFRHYMESVNWRWHLLRGSDWVVEVPTVEEIVDMIGQLYRQIKRDGVNEVSTGGISIKKMSYGYEIQFHLKNNITICHD